LTKQRLDTILVNLNFCDSRQQAQRLIRAGEVKVNQQVIDKPGTEIDPASEIQLRQKPKYVSRGGEKLAKALKLYNIAVEGRICLDGGISTGGFTDCLLQAGARQVYGVDVGYGQVAWSLRQDERVILKERTNFRYLVFEDLYAQALPADLGVMDLSFISLTKVLEPLWQLLVPPREAILLIKPQFEVGRERVGKNGVVRNAEDRAIAIHNVLQAAQAQGWHYNGLTSSPITGPKGNLEYLLWLSQSQVTSAPDLNAIQEIAKAQLPDSI
jgi:23S rRNA (cytidine1920-2'-O)/16S rRNA (cytidine1409-2'-O)-methyltransferase